MSTLRARTAAAAVSALLAACGGGGEDARSSFVPSIAVAGQCAPDNTLAQDSAGNLLPQYSRGSLESEKSWVRSYVDEAYLWYKEIPPVDANAPEFLLNPPQRALEAWFEALKTPALTPSGARKDRFSFTLPTAQWNALSQTGVVGGYGVEWALISRTAPRNIRAAYVEAQSPAASAGVVRGDAVKALILDGVEIDVVNTTAAAEIARLNEALFSPVDGSRATFRLLGNDNVQREVTLTASQVTTTPVKEAKVLDAGGTKVGYLLFNDFIVPAEGQLKSAMQGFQSAGVRDLVLDLRYNGGGFLYMASQLAYMIAPPARTAGNIFERSLYSDKRQAATNSPSSILRFQSSSSGVAGSNTVANAPLPNLGLERVYLLTTGATCSASESVINGLRGVDIEVILLGAPTCGKPYGFTAKDNCGLSYFPVEFQGVNDKGFGDFAEGFAPACAVGDDLESPLGSEQEGLLAAALAYRGGASCAAIAARGPKLAPPARAGDPAADAGTATIVRPPARSNKYVSP